MSVESLNVSGLVVHYDASERDTAILVQDACAYGVSVIRECWGLEPPTGCAVFVMTSWLDFVFRSAPWRRRVMLAVFFPFWCFKAMNVWKAAGGWVQGHGQAPAVGIKPPRLVAGADRSIGDSIFVRDVGSDDEVRQIVCHELTHAFSNHLRLPTWLHEGMAMVSVDRLRGRPSVRMDTLELIKARSIRVSPSGYPGSLLKDPDAWVYLYARGYWLTCYLLTEMPGLVPELLEQRRPQLETEEKLAAAFGLCHEEFWGGVDELLVDHFKE